MAVVIPVSEVPKDDSLETFVIKKWTEFYKKPTEDQIEEVVRAVGLAMVRDYIVEHFDENIVEMWIEDTK